MENSQDDSFPRNLFCIKETETRAKSKVQLLRPPEKSKDLNKEASQFTIAQVN